MGKTFMTVFEDAQSVIGDGNGYGNGDGYGYGNGYGY